MAPVTVAVHIQKHRAFAFAAQLGGALHRVAHGEHVHAVDDLGVHVVVGEPGRPARHAVHAHDFVVAAMGHAVVVVADQEDDRQPELVAVGQMIGELGLRGEVQRFQHDAVGIRAVAGKAADDIAAFEVAVGQRRARGDRHAAADDGVGAEVADGEVSDVHRAAAATAVAVVLAEQLADGAIDVFLQRGFEQVLVLAGRAIRHALAKLLIGHLADGDGALGQAFAVAAVRAGDVVGQLQRAAGAGGGAFLADRHVRRAAVVVVADRLVGARPELDDHLFQLADDQHVFQDRNRLGGRDRLRFKFGREIRRVAIGGNLAAIDFIRRELRPRIAQVGG